MYSNQVRSDEYKQRILDFIRREYGINSNGIYPTKRGFYGETWRLETSESNYFLKAVYPDAHKSVYKASFPVIDCSKSFK